VPNDWDPSHFDVDHTNVMLSLIGRSADEIVAAFEAATGPRRHRGVDELVRRADPRDVPALTELTAAAVAGDARPSSGQPVGPRTITPLATRGAVRPWQVMLSAAGTERESRSCQRGMRPAAVEVIFHALRTEQSWIRRGNREDLTSPVAELREQVVAARLLRKHPGRLVLIRLGRQVDGDASAIWEALAARLVRTRGHLLRTKLHGLGAPARGGRMAGGRRDPGRRRATPHARRMEDQRRLRGHLQPGRRHAGEPARPPSVAGGQRAAEAVGAKHARTTGDGTGRALPWLKVARLARSRLMTFAERQSRRDFFTLPNWPRPA
jgi:hypothetical protein